jgi:bacterial/archaeal transporter family protein
MRAYVVWAIIGMIGYSFTTLFVKLAVRTGHISSFSVLAVATVMVAVSSVAIAVMRGELATVPGHTEMAALLWAGATGLSLTIAVSSLFRALSLGPASVVVPLYGMFIIGGALLGVLFLDEPLSLKKVAGLTAAIAGAYLVSS